MPAECNLIAKSRIDIFKTAKKNADNFSLSGIFSLKNSFFEAFLLKINKKQK